VATSYTKGLEKGANNVLRQGRQC